MPQSTLTYCPVANIDAVTPGTGLHVEVEGRTIALFNVAGTFHAVDGICTHAYAELADGYVEGETVECPLHGACFSLRTGEALSPPATEPLVVYSVHVEGDTVSIALPSGSAEQP